MTTTATTIEPRTVAELLADDTDMWRGPSGENVNGEAAARHLEATAALLERDGWTRVYDTTGPTAEEPAPGDSSTLRERFAWIFRVVRSEYDSNPARTLGVALLAVSNSASGDADTESAAEAVLRAVLRARTGARYVQLSAWASRLNRTWPQVRDLLTEAAAVAREFGPAA